MKQQEGQLQEKINQLEPKIEAQVRHANRKRFAGDATHDGYATVGFTSAT
jgi:hypothetical protein